MFCKHCAERDACISAVYRACFEPACGTSLAYTETGASTLQGEVPATKGCAELTETTHHAAGTTAAAATAMTTTAAATTTTATTTTAMAGRH